MIMVIRNQIFKIWNLFLDVDVALLVLTRLPISFCRESRKMWTKAPSIQICSCWSLRKEKKVWVLWRGWALGGLHVVAKGRTEKWKPSCPSGCRVDGQWTGHPHPWAGQARPSINNPKCLPACTAEAAEECSPSGKLRMDRLEHTVTPWTSLCREQEPQLSSHFSCPCSKARDWCYDIDFWTA